MTEPVTITVNGIDVTAPAGELVIDAVERAGAYIPRFCYHPRMRPVGMCRMCIVDVDTGRGPALQPSCMIPVSDGMVVDTTTERTKKAQDGVLEFLLINHPLDCPVCDRGGECPLQDQTMAYGPGESRFIEEKRHFEKPIPVSGLVLLDRERCILCDRCTRFSAEVAGDPLISFMDRGSQTQVNTFPDHPFASYFSGNTVQICPVGALLASPYRFRARPWDLAQTESTCTTCSVGCRVAVQSSRNQVLRYLGVDVDPVNWSWLCDKGRFDFEALNSENRLDDPMVRAGEGFSRTRWSSALAAAAEGIEAARAAGGPGAIGVIGGSRLTNEAAYAWTKLAKAVIGTDNVDAQLGDGLPAEAVLGLPRATIDELCSADLIVTLSGDVKEELPVLYLRLRHAAVEDGRPIIEITPTPTGLTPYAASSLVHRPGAAAQVAAAITGEATDQVGGVAVESIAAAAQTLRQVRDAGGRVVVLLGRPSVAESADHVLQAAGTLQAELGDAVRFVPGLRRGNVVGALEMGMAPGFLPGRVTLDDGRVWFTDHWGGVPGSAGLDTTGMLQAAADGRIKALILVGADPLADFPDAELARRAIERVDFIVAVDTFLTGSGAHADVLLPAAGFAEVGGTTTNLEGRISVLNQKVTPPCTSQADWIIAAELAHRLGTDLGFESLDGVWDEIEHVSPIHFGLTREVLTAPGAVEGVVAPATPDQIEAIMAVRGGTPVAIMGLSGNDLAVGTAAAAPEVGVDPHADGQTGAPGATDDDPGDETAGDETAGHETDAGDEDDEDDEGAEPGASRPVPFRFTAPLPGAGVPAPDGYGLRLVSGRKLYDAGVGVQQSPSLAGLAPGAVLRVNPADNPLGSNGDTGRVRVSAHGRPSVTVDIVPDPGLPKGTAALAFNQPGAAASDLIDVTSPVTDLRLETAGDGS